MKKILKKIVKNKFTAVVGGIIDVFMRFPLVPFSLTILLLYPSLKGLFLFILLSLICLLLRRFASLAYDIYQVQLLSKFVEKYKDSSYTLFEYSELPLGFSEEKVNIMNSILCYSKPDMNLGFVFAKNEGEQKEHVSFPFYNKEPLVFLKSPVSVDMLIFDKFKILHEIGHWCYFDHRSRVQKITSVVSFVFLISISIFLVESRLSLFFLFLVGFVWCNLIRSNHDYYETNKISEVLADVFGLNVLQEDQDVEPLYSFLKKYFPERYDEILFFKDWFEDPVDIENDKFFQKAIPSKWKHRILKNQIVNFSSAAEKFYVPPFRANTILLVCIVGMLICSNVVISSALLWCVGILALVMLLIVLLFRSVLELQYSQSLKQLNFKKQD